jgi:hypothetical protein
MACTHERAICLAPLLPISSRYPARYGSPGHNMLWSVELTGYPVRTNTPACSRCSLQHRVCTPGCSTSANRNFKRPVSPTINLSLSQGVVNRNQQSQSIARVWGENCGFAGSLRAMHRPEVADFETVWTLARVRHGGGSVPLQNRSRFKDQATGKLSSRRAEDRRPA